MNFGTISVLRNTIPIVEGKGEGKGESNPASSHPKAVAVTKEGRKHWESKAKVTTKPSAMKSEVGKETDLRSDTNEKKA